MNLVLLTSRSFHIDCPVLRLRVFIVFLLKGWCLCLILHIFCLGRFTEMVDLVSSCEAREGCVSLGSYLCTATAVCDTCSTLFCFVLYHSL